MTAIVLVALAIAVGLVGILIPFLPGTLLIWAAIAVWAVLLHNVTAWVTLAVVTLLLGATTAIKYLWPARRMRRAEVPSTALLVGGLVGVVGFFVIPVLGLVIGFVLGVYLAELAHRRDYSLAWRSTVQALKGVALSMGVELTGALLATAVWVAAVLSSHQP